MLDEDRIGEKRSAFSSDKTSVGGYRGTGNLRDQKEEVERSDSVFLQTY